MRSRHSNIVLILTLTLVSAVAAHGQKKGVTVLTDAEAARIVPSGFYFEGQSAPTQMRNAAAARIGEKQHVIAGIVDTSGYSSEIRAKYEGFLITDAPIEIGGQKLGVGAYGFGFSDEGKVNIFDVGGNPVLSAAIKNDKNLRRPRPLMMMLAENELRLYSGRNYVVISIK